MTKTEMDFSTCRTRTHQGLMQLHRLVVLPVFLLPLLLLVLLGLNTFFSSSANAAIFHDQSLKWQTLTSKHFELHYHDGEQALAEKSINIAEKVLIDLQPTFNWIPKEKIEIILSDEIDVSNGFVIAPFLPSLRITIFPTTPDNPMSFSEYNDWLTLLITHELTHALHIDKGEGKVLTLRNLFGRHPLSFPNIWQPPWLLEGLATYLETDKKNQSGRGQDDIYAMMMRLEVKSGIKTYEEINIGTSNWPAGITSYLYGVHFFQFLESQYSKASISRFIASYSDNLLPFSLNENSIRTYGKTMPQLWVDFEKYLQHQYMPQLSNIIKNEIVVGEKITNNGYFKNYIQPLDDEKLLYSQYDGKTRPSLQLQKPEINKTETIAEIHNNARLDYHPTAGVLVSQLEFYRNTHYLHDIFQINLTENAIDNLNNDKKFDENNKILKRLTRGDRYRRAVWNPSGEKIIAVYNKNSKHTLALLNDDGRLIDLLWEGKAGEYISDIDWSPDGEKLIASVKRQTGSWNIEAFSLEKRSWKLLIASDENEIQPKYAPNGETILFSANYNGVYNIHEYNIASQTIDQLSNVEGGAFHPTLDNNEQIFYIGYSENGYDIFKISHKKIISSHKIEQVTLIKENNTKQTPPSITTKFTTVSFEQTPYRSFSRLTPTWWSPVFAFGKSDDEDVALIGGYLTGSDALKTHTYDATISFDLESSALSGELNYSFDGWFPVLQSRLISLNRKNKRNEIYHFEALAPLLQREKNWYIGATIRNENLTITNNDKQKNTSKDYLVGFGAIYDTRKTNIIANSPSNGRLVTLTAETSELLGSDFNGKMFIANWQEYIALKPEQVLAFRFLSGFGLENPRDFQLGGAFSDGNYYTGSAFSTIPFRTTLYNRRNYSLRGYKASSPSLVGRRMMMYNIEWRFPLKRIEKSASAFPAGLHQISGAAFIESGSAWDSGIRPKDFHYSIGGEIKLHTKIFYLMPMILRLGYAYGADKDGEHQLYMTAGSSF